MNTMAEKIISSEPNRPAPIYMKNRAVSKGFGEESAAITNADIIAAIEIAARDAIAIISSPNPAHSQGRKQEGDKSVSIADALGQQPDHRKPKDHNRKHYV